MRLVNHRVNHRPLHIIIALVASLFAGSAAAATNSSASDEAVQTKIYTGWFSDVAISGYDPVAYFTEGQPTEGSGDITHSWGGATWQFASVENQQAFAANPEKYAPQYGGFCAWAVAAKDDLVKTDPEVWAVKDGKLYLNYSDSVQQKWDKDRDGFIAEGDDHWMKRGYNR